MMKNLKETNDCEIHGYLPCHCKQLEETIKAYLAKPKAPKITRRDHGPWDLLTQFCLGCNKSLLELYSTPIMPRCNVT